MRLGRDATRGVTATAQEKRRINNGGGAWENGMEWKWFRGKGGIDIVQGEIYRNKMWSVEIINSDEIRVKDNWSLEMLSKIESSKRNQLSLKRKVVIKQENCLQRGAVLTFLYKTSPRKKFVQHCSRQHAVHTGNTVRTVRYVLCTRNITEETSCYTQQETQCGQRNIVLCTTRNTVRNRHSVARNKKHSMEETSCYTQQETQCGQRDIVLCTTRNTVRKRHSVARNKKHSTEETSCYTQQETQCGQWDFVLHATRNTTVET